MFFMKKLVLQFLYPLQFSMLVLIVGVVLLLFTRKQKLGKSCCACSLLLLLACSYTPLSYRALHALEYQFTPLFTDRHTDTSTDGAAIQWIVVLAGGHEVTPHLPAVSQLSSSSLARVVEAVRVHQHIPHSKLVFSGGMLRENSSTGATMAAAAHELGVSPRHTVAGPLARDTREEAVALSKLVGAAPFVLVTSASHMPRSVALFTKVGMQPLPSPADHRTRPPTTRRRPLSYFFPQVSQLERSTKAVREYLGIIWAKLRGQI